jgi:hypothetical protein
MLLPLLVASAAARNLTKEDLRLVCMNAPNDGRWGWRPVDNGSAVPEDAPAVTDWQWSEEAMELCGVHHFSSECVQ